MTPEAFDLARTPLLRGVTLLEASAGTGKTFTIAGLFLRLLLEQRLTVDQILVVTFTEAATAELRGRIRERLSEARDLLRAGHTDDPLWSALLFAGEPGQRSERLAQLEAALEQFDEAAVFTIHGFCQRVLQERAFESRVLFDAELTPDVTPFLREVTDNFWRRHFYEAPLRQVWLAQQAKLTPDSLFELLRQHTQQAQVKVLARGTDSLWTAALTDAESALDAAGALWRKDRDRIVACFGESGGVWGNLPYNRSSEMAPRFATLDLLFSAAPPPPNGAEVLAEFGQSVLAQAKTKTVPRAEVPRQPFFAACDRFGEALAVWGSRMRYEFLTRSRAELNRLKERDRRFGFDDLLHRVADTLSGPSGPGLATALRRRYRAALIDEFQDTDPIQWRIFETLFATDESFLLLVGDPKQAIYSFRGADVFAYLRARNRAAREFTLGENWRSEANLVAATNQVFSRNPRPFALSEIAFYPVAARGRADATPLTEDGVRVPPLQVWYWNAEADQKETVGDQKQRLAEAVADELVRLLGGSVRLGDRPLAPGDVAVLVDSHFEAELVATALTRRRLPSVQRTQQSVFATQEAAAVQSLLEALVEGGRVGPQRTALTTSLVGLSAAELDALESNESAWEGWLETLARWSELWSRHGFLTMFETVLRERQTRGRLLARAEGERRLTNFLHLGELLQQTAAQERLTPRALVTWLASQRGRADEGEAAAKESLLRLERDAAAVQLVTFHSSKGLEYPVVFCPFVCRRVERPHAPVLFHDPEQDWALFHDVGSRQMEENRRRMLGENFAENLRLLYVALTRAQHRCYVGWGVLKYADMAGLSWLLHPPPIAPGLDLDDIPETLKEFVDGLDDDDRQEAVTSLEGPSTTVRALPPLTDQRWQPPEVQIPPVEARVFHREIRRDWGLASFSTLAQGQVEEAPDRDAVDRPLPNPVDSPLAQFRGTRAGNCLHEVLEELDFTQADAGAISAKVSERLRAHGFPPELLTPEVSALIERVLSAEVAPGVSFRAIAPAQCWRELEFLLPLNRITPAGLRAAFADALPEGTEIDLLAALNRLGFAEVEGFLTGFMDLVLVHEGRWWLVDWKSNWLGDAPEDYGPMAMRQEMVGQQYMLQYHLYLLALDRLLRSRLPDYDYDQHVGGVVYVFVRGVTATNPELGLFRDRPSRATLEVLAERLLGPVPEDVP